MNKEESLSMTIRKVTDNIEILMNGGKLFDEAQDEVLTFDEMFLNCKSDDKALGYGLEIFSTLTEHIEPKTEREVELETKIAELEARLKADVTVYGVKRINKKPVILSEARELEMCERWKSNIEAYKEDENFPKPFVKDLAKEFKIANGTCSKILDKHNCRNMETRVRVVTDA